METLKELRVKYKQLKKEGDDIYNKIKILEKKELSKKSRKYTCLSHGFVLHYLT